MLFQLLVSHSTGRVPLCEMLADHGTSPLFFMAYLNPCSPLSQTLIFSFGA